MNNTERARYIIDVVRSHRSSSPESVNIRVEELDNDGKTLSGSKAPGFRECEYIIETIYNYMKNFILGICKDRLRFKNRMGAGADIDSCGVLNDIEQMKFTDEELELLLAGTEYDLYLVKGIQEKLGERKFFKKYLFPLNEIKIIDNSTDCEEMIALVYSEKEEDGCIFLKVGVTKIGLTILYVFSTSDMKDYLASNAIDAGIDNIILCGSYAVSLHKEFEKAFNGVNIYSFINRDNLDDRISISSEWIKKYIHFPEQKDWGINNFIRGLLSCTKENPSVCLEALALTNLAEYFKEHSLFTIDKRSIEMINKTINDFMEASNSSVSVEIVKEEYPSSFMMKLTNMKSGKPLTVGCSLNNLFK